MAGYNFGFLENSGLDAIAPKDPVLAETSGDPTSGMKGRTSSTGNFSVLASGSGQTTSQSMVTLETIYIFPGEMQAGDRYFVLTQWHEVAAGDFLGIIEISGPNITTGSLMGIMGNTAGSVALNGHQMSWCTQHSVTNDLGMVDGIRSLNGPDSVAPLTRTVFDTNLANWISKPHTLKVQMRTMGANQEISMSYIVMRLRR